MSCRAQVDTMAAGADITIPSKEVLEHTSHLYQPGTRRPYGVLEWAALIRLLEAESASSGFPRYDA
jgi:hypothetical protein